MKINEVTKITNLTKKAIRYYEDKTLISPKVDMQTGYKKYSQKNVEELSQIAILRNFLITLEELVPTMIIIYPKLRN